MNKVCKVYKVARSDSQVIAENYFYVSDDRYNLSLETTIFPVHEDDVVAKFIFMRECYKSLDDAIFGITKEFPAHIDSQKLNLKGGLCQIYYRIDHGGFRIAADNIFELGDIPTIESLREMDKKKDPSNPLFKDSLPEYNFVKLKTILPIGEEDKSLNN